VRLDRVRDAFEQCDEILCLMEAVREAGESCKRLLGRERLQICVRARCHRIENFPGVPHDDVGSPVRERRRDQRGNFLIVWIVVSEGELERIGCDRGDVERRHQSVEALPQQFLPNRAILHVI